MCRIESEKIFEMKALFNRIIFDKTEDNLPKYVLLAGAGCSISSNVASGKQIIDMLQKYTYLCYCGDNKIESAVQWNRQSETFEEYVSQIENLIDLKSLQSYVGRKQSEFSGKLEKSNIIKDMLQTLPKNLKEQNTNLFDMTGNTLLENTSCNISEVWQKYSKYFLEELQYSFWMQEYSTMQGDIQNLIENLIKDKAPAVEYYLFADLVAKGAIYNIFTTNFDEFFQEAFSFLGLHPYICTYEDKAETISFQSRKPNIIKLHGDYLYKNTRNFHAETSVLHNTLKIKLQDALKQFGMIVVGYAGNDYSVMSILEEQKSTGYPLYWCILQSDLENDRIPWRVKELICNTENSFFVPIQSFEQFVRLFWIHWHQHMQKDKDRPDSVIARVGKRVTELSEALKIVMSEKEQSVVLSDGVPLNDLSYDYTNLPKVPNGSSFIKYSGEVVRVDINENNISIYEAAKRYREMDLEERNLVEHIIKLIGDFVFLTSNLITLLLYENGIHVKKLKVQKIIKRLIAYDILCKYRFESPIKKSNYYTYSLGYNGAKLFQQLFNHTSQWSSTLQLTTSAKIKKHLVAAQAVFGFCKHMGNISYQIAPKLGGNQNLVRPTALFQYTKDDVEHWYLLEVVREELGWEDALLEKLSRYNRYIIGANNPITLIICGEEKEHMEQLFQEYRKWKKRAQDNYVFSKLDESNIWFTEDVAFFSKNLSNTFVKMYCQDDINLAVPIDISIYFNLIEQYNNAITDNELSDIILENENIDEKDNLKTDVNDKIIETGDNRDVLEGGENDLEINKGIEQPNITFTATTLLGDIYLFNIHETMKILENMVGRWVCKENLESNYGLAVKENKICVTKNSMWFYTGFSHQSKGKVYMYCTPNSRRQPWKFERFFFEDNENKE